VVPRPTASSRSRSPGNCFAVFTHRGQISQFSETVKQVWGVWLPASSLRYQHHPVFELYDDRFDPITGEGEVDLYVPIDAEGARAQG
jgi:AraC family transcriptional regulator